MSGIYIKGMEMPKDETEELYIVIRHDGTVHYSLDLKCKIIANAIPVPNHGDLIDRDELEPDDGWSDRCDGFTTFSKLAINCAPSSSRQTTRRLKNE